MTSPASSPLVVDSSALVAVLFGEPQGERLRERLRGVAMAAPTLLRYELANATWKKIRQQGHLRDDALTILDRALRLPIEYHEVDHVSAARLGLEVTLTAYDASYLWLAETLNLELMALDGPLLRAYTARR